MANRGKKKRDHRRRIKGLSHLRGVGVGGKKTKGRRKCSGGVSNGSHKTRKTKTGGGSILQKKKKKEGGEDGGGEWALFRPGYDNGKVVLDLKSP